ncbi:MAG: DUF2283 domain-containing protein [Elainellaceae cyanobacterium]
MKIKYSEDVDVLLIEVCDRPIAYAEDADNPILHYDSGDRLVLVEILNFRRSMPNETATALISA